MIVLDTWCLVCRLKLQLQVDSGAGVINAFIQEPNLQSGNAVAHVIDSVLSPPAAASRAGSGGVSTIQTNNQTYASVARALQAPGLGADWFLALAQAAGLTELLTDATASRTWLVPSTKVSQYTAGMPSPPAD